MISVVIPCYNCESTVKRAVDSVLNQEFIDYELVLVDNCSSDGTIQVLNAYQKLHPDKIRVFREPKQGAPAARNKGLGAARGEWVQFLDADDELRPGKLARQIELVKKSNAGLVVGNYILEWIKGTKPVQMNRSATRDPWEGLIASNLGITSANLWRKRNLQQVRGWNEDMSSSQEYDLLFRLLQNNTEVVFDDAYNTVVYHYRNSTSKSTDEKKLIRIVENRIRLRQRIKEYLLSINKLTPEKNRAIDTYIYFELKRNSLELVDFVKKYLRENTLEVPWNTMIRINSRVTLRKIRYYLYEISGGQKERYKRKNLS